MSDVNPDEIQIVSHRFTQHDRRPKMLPVTNKHRIQQTGDNRTASFSPFQQFCQAMIHNMQSHL